MSDQALVKNCGSLEGIATGYGLDDRVVGVRVLCLLHIIQTGSGVHTTSYPIGSGAKATGASSWPLTSN
jgi:phage shock protein PspC (stress-responsive transcriptional regulator)